MKLSTWAKQQGIHYQTAWRWWKSGKLPVEAIKAPSGAVIINPNTTQTKKEIIVAYCRVSNNSRKKELEYQVSRCQDFCVAKGWPLAKTYKEVASGMNDNRKELWKMLELNPTKVIVENKDRLTRFGFNYLERLLKRLGCEVVVINDSNTDEEDLLKDLVAVVTSFCCRLYGLRRGHNKAKNIKNILKND